MPWYLSAKEFRQRIPRIAEDLKRWGEIIVLKKAKPIFSVQQGYLRWASDINAFLFSNY